MTDPGIAALLTALQWRVEGEHENATHWPRVWSGSWSGSWSWSGAL